MWVRTLQKKTIFCMQYINHFPYSLYETPKNDFTLTFASHFVSLFIIHILKVITVC